MPNLTTITTKGQVTIPGSIRRSLGIQIGDKVAFSDIASNRQEIVLRVIPKSIVSTLYGALKTQVHEPDHVKARAAAGKLLGKRYSL